VGPRIVGKYRRECKEGKARGEEEGGPEKEKKRRRNGKRTTAIRREGKIYEYRQPKDPLTPQGKDSHLCVP